ncbi:MAG TPA: FAD-binding oxidoreductase [Streptosporangiaceae bacterium]|jgi:FAD/FMN-containing dehydrogenase|nr:FAD-binding oxidoreductase [Streptosporangiaceae bacterium]
MTQTASQEIHGLRAVTDGAVIASGEPGFDQARRVWNAEIDKRPAVIARCTTARDVSAAVGFARDHGLEVAVRGGAHNTAGTATCDGGVMVDLSLMSEVSVDPVARRARAGGGALLADLDAATLAHGLAVPAGLISHTGIGGLTLGGGMGWLTRKFGLTIDSLAAAEVVTADGQVRRVSATEEPELFWAIRGGGGNFGVVTGFDFRLHSVDPTVSFGMFFWGLDQGPEVLRLARELTPALPHDLAIVTAAVTAPPAPFVPPEYQLTPGYAMLLAGFGAGGRSAEAEHAAAVGQIRRPLPPLFDLVTPMPYVALQQMLDEANAWGLYAHEKGAYLEDLTDDVIEVVTGHVERKATAQSAVMFYRLDGAYSEVGDGETAFSGGRSPRYAAFMLGVTPVAGELPAARGWVRELWSALGPHAISGGDGYVNGTAEYADERVRGSYGTAKYERLARIKAQYDPANLFHLNANIRPA